jgi:two-component system, NtrC family, response regulator AtoC
MSLLAISENTVESLRLLVISKESEVLRRVQSAGTANLWRVETASSGWAAMERLQSGGAPHILLLDVPRGDADSLHILRWLRRITPDLPVIAVCHADDTLVRNEADRLGIEEILNRPTDERQIEHAIRKHIGAGENGIPEMLSESVEVLDQEAFFVSASPAMRKLRAQAELLAQADVPVFILGENGSGRDAVAKLIHKLSVRSGFGFLKVNCASTPGDMIEQELFGSLRSAGGTSSGSGKLELPKNSTIFLDEIAELPVDLQAKLAHVLQNNELRRPAVHSPMHAPVRILAATSADIEGAIAQKKLLADLCYRLSAFMVRVPPLRQRKEEIPTLLRYWMHKLAKRYGLPSREFSAKMIATCECYSWPGNLTELEAFVKRYLASGNEQLVPVEAQPVFADRTQRRDELRAVESEASLGQEISEAVSNNSQSLKSLVQEVKCEAEKNAIADALEKTGWNRKAAARLLKVSYRTLLYKIEQYQMSAPMPSLSVARFQLHPGARGSGKTS